MDQEKENKEKKEDILTEITDEKVMEDIGHSSDGESHYNNYCNLSIKLRASECNYSAIPIILTMTVKVVGMLNTS